MRILIIEDELPAARRIEQLIRQQRPQVEILAVIDSISEAVKWFAQNPAPELILMDIHLADGLSFDIFQSIKIQSMVIFTTAYDQYAIRAFKVNSIDYLLKPFELVDLQKALEKWRLLRADSSSIVPGPDAELMRLLMQQMSSQIRQPSYKTRFMVKIGDHLHSITSAEIDYLYSENKIVWLRHQNGRKYLIDYTLEQLEDMLDPDDFYRINRKYIISIGAIKSVASYTNSRLKVLLKEPPDQEDVLISREKVEAFKGWLGR